MLVLDVQQSASALHAYTPTRFLRFFSHIGRYRVLGRVPCAIQQVLIIYFIPSSVYVSIPIFQFKSNKERETTQITVRTVSIHNESHLNFNTEDYFLDD